MSTKGGKLTIRLIVPTFVLIAIVSLLLMWLLSQIARESLAVALQERGKSLAENLAYNSEFAVLTGQKELLNALVGGMVRQDDILYVTIQAENGSVLAHWERKDFQPTSSPVPAAFEEQQQTGPKIRQLSIPAYKHSFYEFEAPVASVKKEKIREEIGLDPLISTSSPDTNSQNTRVIGTVRIGISSKRIGDTVNHFISTIGILMFMAVALITLIVGFTIFRVVIKPTQKLAYSMQKVADGDLSTQVSIAGEDEIAQLARSFNVMADSLKEAHEQLEDKVEERTKQLRQALKELEAFSYSVSHDLRAPLRAIDGFSRVLEEDCSAQLDTEGKRLLKVVRDNTRSMGTLIDELLAFFRMGRQEMKGSQVNMEHLARDVFQNLESQNPGRVLQLDLEPLPHATADRAMIRQVFVNLLSNAIKFTRPREVARIQVTGKIEGPEIVYSVNDNGVGFDMRYLDKLFGVFQRLHSAEEFEGTGVGLGLVHRIIHRHGGRVWAEGKLDEGATFYFTLPAKGENHDTERSGDPPGGGQS